MTQFHFSYLLSKCPVSKYRHSEGLGFQQMNGGRPISALNRLAFSVNPILSPGEWTLIWRISVDCLLSPSLAQSPLDFRPSGHLFPPSWPWLTLSTPDLVTLFFPINGLLFSQWDCLSLWVYYWCSWVVFFQEPCPHSATCRNKGPERHY